MALSTCNVHTDASGRELKSHGSTAFPVACYEDNMQELQVPLHWHTEFEYIRAMVGTVHLRVGTEQLQLTAGDGILINSGCLHGVDQHPEKPGLLHSLVIHPRLIAGSENSCFYQSLILPFDRQELQYIPVTSANDGSGLIRDLMEQAWNYIRKESFDYENEARYLISKAFRLITDHSEGAHSIDVRRLRTVAQMKTLLSYIEENYAGDLSNEVLAHQALCSESVLLRKFKESTGTTPGQYILNYRLEKAADRLSSTDLKICDIAEACGFSDLSYFTKVFRRKYGKTPGEYRKFFF